MFVYANGTGHAGVRSCAADPTRVEDVLEQAECETSQATQRLCGVRRVLLDVHSPSLQQQPSDVQRLLEQDETCASTSTER